MSCESFSFFCFQDLPVLSLQPLFLFTRLLLHYTWLPSSFLSPSLIPASWKHWTMHSFSLFPSASLSLFFKGAHLKSFSFAQDQTVYKKKKKLNWTPSTCLHLILWGELGPPATGLDFHFLYLTVIIHLAAQLLVSFSVLGSVSRKHLSIKYHLSLHCRYVLRTEVQPILLFGSTEWGQEMMWHFSLSGNFISVFSVLDQFHTFFHLLLISHLSFKIVLYSGFRLNNEW